MRMKAIILHVIAAVIAISIATLKKEYSASGTCQGYYYWFKVDPTVFANCSEAEYFLEFPPDYNYNGYPDWYEIPQGNSSQAEYQFGCQDSSEFCCAMGYELRDLELTWDGRWRPKWFAMPQCVVRRSF